MIHLQSNLCREWSLWMIDRSNNDDSDEQPIMMMNASNYVIACMMATILNQSDSNYYKQHPKEINWLDDLGGFWLMMYHPNFVSG